MPSVSTTFLSNIPYTVQINRTTLPISTEIFTDISLIHDYIKRYAKRSSMISFRAGEVILFKFWFSKTGEIKLLFSYAATGPQSNDANTDIAVINWFRDH